MALRAHALLVIAALVALDSAPSAQAQDAALEHRVGLLSPGAELAAAARAALEPWGVELVILEGASPGSSAPAMHATARALAQAHAVSAIVWVSEHAEGHAVWAFDVSTEHVVALPIGAAPPFDGPAAAAVALTIKTLLRHSSAAPEAERFGAAETQAAARPTPPPAAQPEASPEPVQQDDRALDAARPRSRFELELAIGLRASGADPEPRAGVAFSIWPGRGALGLGVRATAGPGLIISEPAFEGRFLDVSLAAGAHARVVLDAALQLSTAAGFGVHLTSLDGTPRGERAVAAYRIVPALELETGVDWLASAALRLGLRAQLSFGLRPQRYLVHGEPVWQPARWALEAGLAAAFMFPE